MSSATPAPDNPLPGWVRNLRPPGAAVPGSDDERASSAIVDELRRLQDLAHSSRLAPADAERVARLLAEANEVLAAHPADEDHQFANNQFQLEGRGQSLVPLVRDLRVADGRYDGRVTYGRFYNGRGYAAHGGTVPLLFDDVLGRTAGSLLGQRFRTAYLHVDYRSITPIGPELTVEGWVDRIEGRKVFTVGRLQHDGVVCAEANALFLTLRPEQP